MKRTVTIVAGHLQREPATYVSTSLLARIFGVELGAAFDDPALLTGRLVITRDARGPFRLHSDYTPAYYSIEGNGRRLGSVCRVALRRVLRGMRMRVGTRFSISVLPLRQRERPATQEARS